MSVLGTIGLAALNTAANSVNNWLQGQSNVRNSKRLMDYQSKKQVETQSQLNMRLYPEQVASMRAAGLSPAMLEGPMSAASAAAPSATQNMPAAQFDAINAANAVSNLKLNDSQRQVNLAQAENLSADAASKRQDVENKKLEQELLGNRLFTWFQDWQAEKAVQSSQVYSNNQLGDYYGMQRSIGAQTIVNLKEELLNIAEIRQKIKAETAKTWSEKSYQDKVNNKYDDYIDAQIKQVEQYTQFMDHDDARKALEIVKRLTRMDIENENAVWQQWSPHRN